MEGNHFKVGDLLPVLPNAESLPGMLKEFESDIMNRKKKATSEKDGGINNILDEMLENCNKFKYRVTQK